MKLDFYKYQGTGNDFILIDGRTSQFIIPTQKKIAFLCHRQLGIGADGLIIIRKSKDADFEMLYFNADGNLGSMCGNGGRCTIAFAKKLGIIKNKTCFMAYDGLHEGSIDSKKIVTIKMADVSKVNAIGDDFELNTGSPHYVVFKQDISSLDVFQEGQKIRNNKTYQQQGINVNFVQINKNHLAVRTYERGVENETLSCGTGVTASAISYASIGKEKKRYNINILTPGGKLNVKFYSKDHKHYTNIYLKGPANMVYQGKINF